MHNPTDEHVGQVVLKVAQRCNLNCTYCYVYNRGDESWRTRPAHISDEVAQKLGARIREHCQFYGDECFTVELHGGEPLLLGRKRMQRVIDLVRAESAPVRVIFTLQTNATLLDPKWLELFARNRITFGISLDGPPEIADRRRVKRNGGGSTERVLFVVKELREHGPLFDQLFGGCLCVIDPSSNGADLVEWFVDQGFHAFDFLLPDANRANPPQEGTSVEPYRRFLLEAFERWYNMGARAPKIRTFEQMMLGLMGKKTPLDSFGGDLRGLCVVESDGSIGVNDVMRICGGDFSHDKLNIFEHRLDEHVDAYRIAQIQKVCAECRECPYLDSCGGGYLPHRFDGIGFANPSYFCDALFALSERMQHALQADLPPAAWTEVSSGGVAALAPP
jgi:uncharacterized protein